MFCTLTSIAINTFLETSTLSVSPSLLWETLKAYLRGEIIAYSSHRNRERKRQKQKLIDAISEVDCKYSTSPNPSLYKERLALQTQYNLISTSERERLIMRSHYEHGEKAGRLLAHQLKSKSASQSISQIEETTGEITTDPLKINDTFKKYYFDLYT